VLAATAAGDYTSIPSIPLPVTIAINVYEDVFHLTDPHTPHAPSLSAGTKHNVSEGGCVSVFRYEYTRGFDKSLARPTSRCILFDGENISFDVSPVLYTYIYIYK
jgi:hypothetical protein